MAYLFPHDDRKPPQILVVDDDEMLRELVVECIREEGYVVDVCGDGADALRTKKSDNMIITDMRLPSLDGLSLIRKLKSKNSSTDVIVITGYGRSKRSGMHEGRSAGIPNQAVYHRSNSGLGA